MITIVFVDDGQDFLEWDVNPLGIVVDCRPFQSWVWVGVTVFNHKDVKPGDHITIITKNGDRRTISHAVESVKQIA